METATNTILLNFKHFMLGLLVYRYQCKYPGLYSFNYL